MVMLEVTEKTMKTNMEVMVTELETGKIKNDSSILCSHDRILNMTVGNTLFKKRESQPVIYESG